MISSNKLKKVLQSVFLLVSITGALPAAAGGMGTLDPIVVTDTWAKPRPWSVTASLGYTHYEGMVKDDGETAIGRLVLGWDMLGNEWLTWGLELGVQSGNTMRLAIPQSQLDMIGGLPVDTTMKPMLDLLVTMKAYSATSLYGAAKAGLAYRQWKFNYGDCISDKSGVAAEIQLGVGYPIGEYVDLSLFYQGIFGGSPDFKVNAAKMTGSVGNIPIQNGVLLGVTVKI